jgi:hypothetical protein
MRFLFLIKVRTKMENNIIGKGAVIVWLWSDKQIENHKLIKEEFEDIRSKNMAGILIGIRATRYELMDEKVTKAIVIASQEAKKNNVKFWVLVDPRYASRYLISATGDCVDNLITTGIRGEHYDGSNPPVTKVSNGKYSVHIEWLLKRHSHMFIDVSLHYEPKYLERAFLYNSKDGKIIKKSIIDITKESRFFVNHSESYVEIFGETDEKYNGWDVIAFPRFETNIMDYASTENQTEFNKIIDTYKKNKIHLDLAAWDEPGYYAEFGRYPVSKIIYTKFAEKYGYNLKDKLYALILDVDDESHIKIRNDYFSLIEDFVFNAQKKLWEHSKKHYPQIESGIHQTWHGESGGTEDMVHGSFDLWKGLIGVSGGFTDEGGAEKLVDIKEENYHHYITNLVLGKSLAKLSKSGIAYYNIWGVDIDGSNPKYPSDVMEYWVDLMGVFSNKWLAHAYGYTGVIGSDRGFGPGYPFNSTWDKFISLNQRIDIIEKSTKLIPPEANIAFIYPIESLKAIGNLSGNKIADKIFKLIFDLTFKGFNLDIYSPGVLAESVYKNKKLVIKKNKYDYLICPYSKIIPRKSEKIIGEMMKDKFPIFFDENFPEFDSEGKHIKMKFVENFKLDKSAELDLIQYGIKKNVYGPENAYVTYRFVDNDIVFTLCPNEFQKYYEGEIKYSNLIIPVEKSNAITIIKVSHKGKILDYIKFDN